MSAPAPSPALIEAEPDLMALRSLGDLIAAASSEHCEPASLAWAGEEIRQRAARVHARLAGQDTP